MVAETPDIEVPICWWPRDQRYAERLAPGTKFADIIGEIDPAGHLRITDRKKDLIKTAGGKYELVIKKAYKKKLYAALAAPFPESCIQRTDGRSPYSSSRSMT